MLSSAKQTSAEIVIVMLILHAKFQPNIIQGTNSCTAWMTNITMLENVDRPTPCDIYEFWCCKFFSYHLFFEQKNWNLYKIENCFFLQIEICTTKRFLFFEQKPFSFGFLPKVRPSCSLFCSSHNFLHFLVTSEKFSAELKFEMIYGILTGCIGFILSVYIITVSFKHVGNEFMKWYTVNTQIEFIPCELSFCIYASFSIYSVYWPVGNTFLYVCFMYLFKNKKEQL